MKETRNVKFYNIVLDGTDCFSKKLEWLVFFSKKKLGGLEIRLLSMNYIQYFIMVLRLIRMLF